MPLALAHRRQKQEDENLKFLVGYLISLRTAQSL